MRALLAAALAAWVAVAQAQPAIIFELGGKNDKSFGQSAWEGAERWKKENNKPYLEFEISNAAQREQALRRMAQRGADPVVAIGFSMAASLEKVAREFPQRRFVLIDAYQTFGDSLTDELRTRLKAARAAGGRFDGRALFETLLQDLTGKPYAQFAREAVDRQQEKLEAHREAAP